MDIVFYFTTIPIVSVCTFEKFSVQIEPGRPTQCSI